MSTDSATHRPHDADVLTKAWAYFAGTCDVFSDEPPLDAYGLRSLRVSVHCSHCYRYDNDERTDQAASGKYNRCSGCNFAYYCSAQHQRDDWDAGHKAFCTERAARLGNTAGEHPRGQSARAIYRDLVVHCLSTARVAGCSGDWYRDAPLLPYLYARAAAMTASGQQCPLIIVQCDGVGHDRVAEEGPERTIDQLLHTMSTQMDTSLQVAANRAHLQRARDRAIRGVSACAVLNWSDSSDRSQTSLLVLLEVTIPPSCRMPRYRIVEPREPALHASVFATSF